MASSGASVVNAKSVHFCCCSFIVKWESAESASGSGNLSDGTRI